MTISSSIYRSFLRTALVAAFVLPIPALAAVKITDAMYNPPGADQGHEWIEVTNNGTDAINLSGYKLFEGGVNHKLTVAIGTSTLLAGEEAIITTDPGQYAADYPAFKGPLFKSSFSLSNTGETIELKDASLAVVDIYSYTAPSVTKEPKAIKTTSLSKKSKTHESSTVSAYAPSDEAAALPLALPALPGIPTSFAYGLGLAALLILGAGAAFYVKPSQKFASETNVDADEFELE